MGKATVIPFGPQHPVLPEPLHLDLVVEDETDACLPVTVTSKGAGVMARVPNSVVTS